MRDEVFIKEGANVDRCTTEGLLIDAELHKALADVMRKHNVSPRDFGALAHSAVEELVNEAILT